MYTRTILLAVVTACYFMAASGLKEGECEVCVKYLTRFHESLSSDERSNDKKISAAFKEFCKNARGKDERLCYYIGGLETSATYIVNEMSKPMSWGVPIDKVCQKLRVKDAQICDLKYDKKLDLSTVDLKKLKVKDLKRLLSDWNEQCQGCTEKTEYVKLVEELMPKYEPEMFAKRQAKSEL